MLESIYAPIWMLVFISTIAIAFTAGYNMGVDVHADHCLQGHWQHSKGYMWVCDKVDGEQG